MAIWLEVLTACSGIRAELGTRCRPLVGDSNIFTVCHTVTALVALRLPDAQLMSLTKFFVLFFDPLCTSIYSFLKKQTKKKKVIRVFLFSIIWKQGEEAVRKCSSFWLSVSSLGCMISFSIMLVLKCKRWFLRII